MTTFRALKPFEVTFQVNTERELETPAFDDPARQAWVEQRIAQGDIEIWCRLTVTAGWTHPSTGELFTARASLDRCSIDSGAQHGAMLQIIEKVAREADLYTGALSNLNEQLRARVVEAHALMQVLRAPERVHFCSTHRLRVPLSDGTEHIPVMLLPTGHAPCMREWADDQPSEWRCVGGKWLRNGSPVPRLSVEEVSQTPQRRIVVTLDVETNMDADTLERRLEAWLDPEGLQAQLLDGETLVLESTEIEVE